MVGEKDILQEAIRQGFDVASNAVNAPAFIACVLLGIMTKSLPEAVASCAVKFFK